MSLLPLTRRRLLGLGLAATGAALVRPGAARAQPPARIRVAAHLGVGSIHLMRGEGRLVLVTEPGWGIEAPLGVGPDAAAYPADLPVAIGAASLLPPALYLVHGATGAATDLALRIAAAGDPSGRVPWPGLHIGPDAFVRVVLTAGLGAPGFLYR